MIGLMHAEWIKLSKRWVVPVMTVILLVLTGLSALLLVVIPNVSPGALEGIPALSRSDASIIGVQTVLGQTWFPLILAVVMLGSEVTSTAWASALTRESRRWMHVVARIVMFSLAAYVATLLSMAIWEGLAAAYTEGAAPFSGSDWVSVLAKALLIVTTWVALGLGAISVIRSTGVAIGAVLAYSFLEGLLTLWRPYSKIALSSATNSLFGEVVADISGGIGVSGTEQLSFGHAIAVVIGWAVFGTWLAWFGLARRDA